MTQLIMTKSSLHFYSALAIPVDEYHTLLETGNYFINDADLS